MRRTGLLAAAVLVAVGAAAGCGRVTPGIVDPPLRAWTGEEVVMKLVGITSADPRSGDLGEVEVWFGGQPGTFVAPPAFDLRGDLVVNVRVPDAGMPPGSGTEMRLLVGRAQVAEDSLTFVAAPPGWSGGSA
jgi:hypothetical protein